MNKQGQRDQRGAGYVSPLSAFGWAQMRHVWPQARLPPGRPATCSPRPRNAFSASSRPCLWELERKGSRPGPEMDQVEDVPEPPMPVPSPLVPNTCDVSLVPVVLVVVTLPA